MFIFIPSSYAQNIRQQEQEKQVQKILDNFLGGDDFMKFKRKHYSDSKGVLDLNLVLKGKKVETVFVDNSTVSPPEFVNDFLKFIKQMNFDFKLPKGERLKIKHQFNIQ